jgi:succinate dehydrogenase / fumarate reductase, membrane anchor subunit
MASVEQAERIPTGRPRPAGGKELYAWIFMRASGLALVLLALGHLVIMHLINSIDNINFEFVAQRYETPFWKVYDLLMLVLALGHGCNGVRTVLEDYLHRPAIRKGSIALLFIVGIALLALGTYVTVTFNPSDFKP